MSCTVTWFSRFTLSSAELQNLDSTSILLPEGDLSLGVVRDGQVGKQKWGRSSTERRICVHNSRRNSVCIKSWTMHPCTVVDFSIGRCGSLIVHVQYAYIIHMLQQFYSGHCGTRTFFFCRHFYTRVWHTAVEVELSPPTDIVHSTASCTYNHCSLRWPLRLWYQPK